MEIARLQRVQGCVGESWGAPGSDDALKEWSTLQINATEQNSQRLNARIESRTRCSRDVAGIVLRAAMQRVRWLPASPDAGAKASVRPLARSLRRCASPPQYSQRSSHRETPSPRSTNPISRQSTAAMAKIVSSSRRNSRKAHFSAPSSVRRVIMSV